MNPANITRYCILSILATLCYAAKNVTVTFETGKGEFNTGEDITMKCMVTTDDPQYAGFTLAWFKKQDGEWVKIASNDDLIEPLSSQTDKYSVSAAFNTDNPKSSTAHLKIMGVEVEDTGTYICRAGYKDSMQDSNNVNIITNPASDSVDLQLTPATPADSSDITFNIAQKVECSGQADTLSSNLQLIMTLDDVTEVTQDFAPTRDIVWTGDVNGMKTPTTRLRLTDEQWLPERAGRFRLSCLIQSGEQRLAIQTFSLLRDETASLECKSNYKRAVRVDDIDVIITCNVKDYNGPLDGVIMQWSFIYNDENVTLYTGDNKHLRIAEQEGDNFKLVIPRITTDMVTTGKAFEYKALLKHKEDSTDIASTIYPLPIDSTRRIITSSANHNKLAMGVLMISSLLLYTLQ